MSPQKKLAFIILILLGFFLTRKKQSSNSEPISKTVTTKTDAQGSEKIQSAQKQNYYSGSFQRQVKNPHEFTMLFGNLFVKENGPQQELRFKINPKARSPLFSELLHFLDQSRVHLQDYVYDTQDCKHFAHQLFHEAQEAGIKAYFVSLAFEQSNWGHAFNAFSTSDEGLVHVDFTGGWENLDTPAEAVKNGLAKSGGTRQFRKDLLWVKVGMPILRLPIDRIPSGLRYSQTKIQSYLKQNQQERQLSETLQAKRRDIQSMEALYLSSHENLLGLQKRGLKNSREIASYNSSVAEFNKLKARYETQSAEFNQILKKFIEKQNSRRFQLSKEISASMEHFPPI